MRYSADFHHHDGHTHAPPGSDQSYLQQLADAVEQTPTGFSLDASVPSQRYNHLPESYDHPYRKDKRQSNLDLPVFSCDLIPCGKRWVIDLTISSVSHYCTSAGFVNQNCFDELTHYSETAFFYMLSRNRSACGIRPYIRATCNPDAESWVATFIDWWLDENGYVDKQKSGVIRWFIRLSGEIKWADTKQELTDKYPDCDPKSFTFIRASLDDNQILMKADPGYLANLKALHPIDQARLLLGNWKIREEAGKVFQRSWFPVVPMEEMLRHQQLVGGRYEEVRFWDLAATEAKIKGPEPCSTSGVRMRKIGETYYIVDALSMMTSPGMTNAAITNTASQDGTLCKVRWEIEPGSSGLRDTYTLMQLLSGYDALGMSPQGDKVMRAKPLATAAFQGFSNPASTLAVKLIRGAWNDRWLNLATSFPDAKAGRDDVDASAGAFAALAQLKHVYKENKATWSR
ncbi:MAG: terminase large subunit domain-containing protein [Stenomitos frigidus ULC029]